MGKIRILLVDDHTAVREAFRIALEINSDIEIIGEARDGQTAVEKATNLEPNIIVMDISMPKMNGVEASIKIRETCPECKILILTMHENRHYLKEALNAGIDAFLLKVAKIETVQKAITALAEGDSYFDKNIVQMFIGNPDIEEIFDLFNIKDSSIFDKKEREVINFLLKGFTIKEIASTLDVPVENIAEYKTSSLEKLNVTSTSELLKKIITKGDD